MTHTTLQTILDENNELFACIGEAKGCPDVKYFMTAPIQACPKCLPVRKEESIAAVSETIATMPNVAADPLPSPSDAV